MTFDLSSPIPNQVRPRGRSLLRRTHNFKSAAVSLIRVIPTVVLSVAGQCGVDAASCVNALWQLVRDTKKKTESFSSFNLWIKNKAIFAPFSHWNWSLHSTDGSLHSVAGWQGLSCVSSTSQAEPPNWDGVWTARVRNCGQACNSDLNSLTQNYLIMTTILKWSPCKKKKMVYYTIILWNMSVFAVWFNACFLAQGEQSDQGPKSVSWQLIWHLCSLQPLLSCLWHSCWQLFFQ